MPILAFFRGQALKNVSAERCRMHPETIHALRAELAGDNHAPVASDQTTDQPIAFNWIDGIQLMPDESLGPDEMIFERTRLACCVCGRRTTAPLEMTANGPRRFCSHICQYRFEYDQ